jgi:hypothetical protein
MKRGLNQENQTTQDGGALFGVLPATGEDAQIRDAIVAKIKTATFSDPVKTKLVNITEQNINAPTGTLEALDSWFTVIEHQDELFDLALDIIKEKVGFNKTDIYDTSRIAAINAAHDASWKYIDSIQTLMRLHDKSNTARTAALETKKIVKNTKMQMLKDQPLINLLHFPKRLNNIFIQSLANVFILLKSDAKLLEHLKHKDVREIALDQYRANIYANTYFLTSQPPIDGYYLNQALDQVQGIQANDTFWKGLFKAIANPPSDSLKIATASTKWTTVAAAVFHWYKGLTDLTDYKIQLFTYFNTRTTKVGEPIDARPDSTEKIYDAVIVAPGVPFIEILKAMDVPTLEFILHLVYTISKNETETLAAISAASLTK